MVSIAFIGAGSVVFTRQLVADILRLPELADARLVLHDIDPEQIWAVCDELAAAHGALLPEVLRAPVPAGAL
ncbi:family 4 glycosyl hydrolase [Promicromonospora soli]